MKHLDDKRGRAKGSPKVGGKVKGSITVHSNAVKEAVLRVFQEVNKDDTYLKALAEEDQRLFLSLLARLIPTAVDVEVAHKIDLGAEIIAAKERLERRYVLEDANTPHPVIEVSHEPIATKPQPKSFGPRNQSGAPIVEHTEADPWPGYE